MLGWPSSPAMQQVPKVAVLVVFGALLIVLELHVVFEIDMPQILCGVSGVNNLKN